MRPSAPWLVTAVGSRLRRTVGHPPYPQLVLVLFIGAVYRDGLWGVPRWDRLVYLYEASHRGMTYALRSRQAEALDAFVQALRARPGDHDACRNARSLALTLRVAPSELRSCVGSLE
ncbi:MAG: hypothetical protein Q8Q58_12115 [Candidatus Rokubacteria bacterium]|nr:hypothetical protein [Candidatus Rokubacteria bacterium]